MEMFSKIERLKIVNKSVPWKVWCTDSKTIPAHLSTDIGGLALKFI